MNKIFSLLLVIVLISCGKTSRENNKSELPMLPSDFDWQGHRGCRGLLPENSIPAFLKALEFPIKTLELDVAISKDQIVIVSHEPWMSSEICSMEDSIPVRNGSIQHLIYNMTYEEIKKYDCGTRGNYRFPTQKPMAVSKPSLIDVVNAVKEYCLSSKKPMPRWNIEIKSQPDYDGRKTPNPEKFVQILLNTMDTLGITDSSTIQSFDVRPLQVIHKSRKEIRLAYLSENMASLESNLEDLSFVPQVYSPNFRMVSKELVDKCHSKGMKLIPWTVNEPSDMQRLIRFGVDGIITDFPDRIPAVLVHLSKN
jgi:glycerophosphoryl diester phosphodiesterase